MKLEVKYFDIGGVSEITTKIMETENFDFSKEQIDNLLFVEDNFEIVNIDIIEKEENFVRAIINYEYTQQMEDHGCYYDDILEIEIKKETT